MGRAEQFVLRQWRQVASAALVVSAVVASTAHATADQPRPTVTTSTMTSSGRAVPATVRAHWEPAALDAGEGILDVGGNAELGTVSHLASTYTTYWTSQASTGCAPSYGACWRTDFTGQTGPGQPGALPSTVQIRYRWQVQGEAWQGWHTLYQASWSQSPTRVT